MNKTKLLLSTVLILSGVAGRFLLVSYVRIPNFEIITTVSLIAGIYLGGIYSIAVPISTIFFSDIAIGNNYIAIFTWSAFAIIGIVGMLYKNRIHRVRNLDSILLGVSSSIFFYAYTNFGWWLMSGMYDHSISGLFSCYVMGLPFFRNQLLGNLIFIPIGIHIAQKVIVFKAFSLRLNNGKNYIRN